MKNQATNIVDKRAGVVIKKKAEFIMFNKINIFKKRSNPKYNLHHEGIRKMKVEPLANTSVSE